SRYASLLSELQAQLAPLAQRALGLQAHEDSLAGLHAGDERTPLAEGRRRLTDLLPELEQLARGRQRERLAFHCAAALDLQLVAPLERPRRRQIGRASCRERGATLSIAG